MQQHSFFFLLAFMWMVPPLVSLFVWSTAAGGETVGGLSRGEFVAVLGPSGSGKSTFLRCLNRMNDLIPGTRVAGNIKLDNEDIYAAGLDVVILRKRVGMVFQKPNPLCYLSDFI